MVNRQPWYALATTIAGGVSAIALLGLGMGCDWWARQTEKKDKRYMLEDPAYPYEDPAAKSCLADCEGRDCGPDGCGGSCGTCNVGDQCSADGTCEAIDGWEDCQASCTGKECGSDGCGGSCGTCEGGQSCSEEGRCGPPPGSAVTAGPSAGCAGHCGEAAPTGCFCDEDCQTHGDCCADACAVCGLCEGGPLPGEPNYGQVLLSLINQYRSANGLQPIPTSAALNFVAQTHARDLTDNDPVEGACSLHSWSDNGPWTSCCYTNDEASAECMWSKPLEMTSYSGQGYEIVAWSGDPMTPAQALSLWKASPDHNALLLNQGVWAELPWQAVGAALVGDFAVVWFGIVPD